MDTKSLQTSPNSIALLKDFQSYAHQMLVLANRGMPRFDFLRSVTKIFLEYSACDAIEIRTEGHNKWYVCEATRHPKSATRLDITLLHRDLEDDLITDFNVLAAFIAKRRIDKSSPGMTPHGSLWINDTEKQFPLDLVHTTANKSFTLDLNCDERSIALIPFTIDIKNDGLLILKCLQSHSFNQYDIEFYEGIANILGLAVADRRTQVALRERVKELTCLYGIARLVEDPHRLLNEIMQGIVELIPPGWMYPDITAGRITIDDQTYTTPIFSEGSQKLTAPVYIHGVQRGAIEVIYMEKKRELDEGPFLKEERDLIDAIAREVAHILEHKTAEEEKTRLQDQLRHADRLATIGQLAAGVAHELNEPLGNILGFAQLAQKAPEIPDQINDDLSKIVNASLHAREIIRKLMVFARQTPSQLARINLNKIVREGLYFFEARCNKAGIDLVQELDENLPELIADGAELNQVLVNLVVNSIQAMPDGGTLTVKTSADDSTIFLTVQDTGAGMSDDVKQQIFIPFFTTKDVDEGTGLGLPVVHGIITSHKGTINVESEVSVGSKFTIQLPRNR